MYRRKATKGKTIKLLTLLALLPISALAQVPVDENGELIGAYEPDATGNEDIPLLSSVDLEELVGPIALYPDDLLAIVLPASAYPLQIVEAARFLEALENDPSLKPDSEWDDSVVALLNYPEVVELLNEDIDWTWRLGEAVVAQQADVVSAIEKFRDRAYAAGNLRSDEYQSVTRDEGIIEITPVEDDVIYVPYYEPERVVVYQPRPVYYYYPRAYPVYYYPYSYGHAFDRGYFWGVTTAFTVGWLTDSLHVYHHSYHGHPYYGRHYWNRWWYRRPTINVYNRTYVRPRPNVTINRYYGGDRWRPRNDRRDYVSNTHVTRTRHITRTPRADRTTTRNVVRRSVRNNEVRRNAPSERSEPIRFRERPRASTRESNPTVTRDNRRQSTRRSESGSSRPTPKVRPSSPRRDDATPRREREAVARLNQHRRAESPRVRQASPAPRARESVARQSQTRRAESPRVRQAAPAPRARPPAARQSESRRSDSSRASSERRQEPPAQRRSEPKRSQESKSGGRSQRNQERRQRR